MLQIIHIAIDGPSGAGKSTLAKNLAKSLGMLYVDTGALYLSIGYWVEQQGIDPADTQKVIASLDTMQIELCYRDGEQLVKVNGQNVSPYIRTGQVAAAASIVSAIPKVREFLLNTQRNIAKDRSCVMDGRDIGTKILPHANVKIFLTADQTDRAERRYQELCKKGQKVDKETVQSDIGKRDNTDTSRETAPLKMASDAVLLNNSGFPPQQTLEAALKIIEAKMYEKTV